MRQSAKLDLSAHSLNNSSSKHKFSFSKSQRFGSPGKILCDSFYELPSTKVRRTTSFGYGHKSLGIRYNKDIAPVGTYDLGTQFIKTDKKGASFGQGREDMQITGPMQQSILKRYIPGPGNYPAKSQLQQGHITLKGRLPDHSLNHLAKIPGPGTYRFQQLGTKMYYTSSRHQNFTNHRISDAKKSDIYSLNKSSNLGPNAYDMSATDINPSGRYVLSKQQNSRARVFSRQPRKQLVYKHMLTTPGPGRYQPFSDFGNLK